MRLTSSEQESLEAILAELSELEQLEVQRDAGTLSRFLRAAKGDRKLAAKRLRETLEWRRTEPAIHGGCPACKNGDAHYLHPVGYCKLGRPIIYSVFNVAKNKVVEDNRRHMVATFEQTIGLMGPGVESWIWFADFKGFGVADCNPSLAKVFLDVSATYYPERLAHFVIADAPSIFRTLWNAVKPFVDPITYKKIIFLPHDPQKQNRTRGGGSVLINRLRELCDEDTVQWIVQEMASNRDKAAVAAKKYDYRNLLLPPTPAAGPTAHNIYGMPAVLEAFRSNPHLLAGFLKHEVDLGRNSNDVVTRADIKALPLYGDDTPRLAALSLEDSAAEEELEVWHDCLEIVH